MVVHYCSGMIILFLCSVLSGETTQGEITWANLSLGPYVLKSTEQSATATYYFKNTGSFPCRIKYINKACSCTTVTEQDDILWYAPGDKGHILLTVDAGDHQDIVKKSAEIVFVDSLGNELSKTLTMTIDTGHYYDVSANHLQWCQDDSNDQFITLTFPDKFPAKISNISFETSLLSFKASYTYDDKARLFRIIITPPKNTSHQQGHMYIETVPPQPRGPTIVVSILKE